MTTISETGCYLDNHRGHYISRDMIELAVGYGYIVGPFERFALDMYEHAFDLPAGVEYPHDTIVELADDAREWLNSGQETRVPGQNFPPIIPAGTTWDWNDGDFGLYSYDEDGELI
jgi:hypothetical protein